MPASVSDNEQSDDDLLAIKGHIGH